MDLILYKMIQLSKTYDHPTPGISSCEALSSGRLNDCSAMGLLQKTCIQNPAILYKSRSFSQRVEADRIENLSCRFDFLKFNSFPGILNTMYQQSSTVSLL